MALATRGPLGVNGLALANAVQNSLHGLVLLALMSRALGGLEAAELLRFSGRALLAAGGMTLALWTTLALLGALLSSSVPGLIVLMSVALTIGVAVYVGAVLALRVTEARQLWSLAVARIRREAIP